MLDNGTKIEFRIEIFKYHFPREIRWICANTITWKSFLDRLHFSLNKVQKLAFGFHSMRIHEFSFDINWRILFKLLQRKLKELVSTSPMES
jgi:hypothetical protein